MTDSNISLRRNNNKTGAVVITKVDKYHLSSSDEEAVITTVDDANAVAPANEGRLLQSF